MKRQSSAIRVALTVLTVLVFVGPVAAGEQVPFRGRLEGSLVSRTPLTPPFVVDTFAITGNATQLGQFELDITATVNLTTRTATGTYVFVAANGDTLTATFTWSSAPTPTPGVILITEVATIDPDGCTGRFAGASGGFTCERLFSPATGETIGSINGTISTPGANTQ